MEDGALVRPTSHKLDQQNVDSTSIAWRAFFPLQTPSILTFSSFTLHYSIHILQHIKPFQGPIILHLLVCHFQVWYYYSHCVCASRGLLFCALLPAYRCHTLVFSRFKPTFRIALTASKRITVFRKHGQANRRRSAQISQTCQLLQCPPGRTDKIQFPLLHPDRPSPRICINKAVANLHGRYRRSSVF